MKHLPDNGINKNYYFNNRLQSLIVAQESAQRNLERSTQRFRQANDRLQQNLEKNGIQSK